MPTTHVDLTNRLLSLSDDLARLWPVARTVSNLRDSYLVIRTEIRTLQRVTNMCGIRGLTDETRDALADMCDTTSVDIRGLAERCLEPNTTPASVIRQAREDHAAGSL